MFIVNCLTCDLTPKLSVNRIQHFQNTFVIWSTAADLLSPRHAVWQNRERKWAGCCREQLHMRLKCTWPNAILSSLCRCVKPKLHHQYLETGEDNTASPVPPDTQTYYCIISTPRHTNLILHHQYPQTHKPTTASSVTPDTQTYYCVISTPRHKNLILHHQYPQTHKPNSASPVSRHTQAVLHNQYTRTFRHTKCTTTCVSWL
jgi:hypothetical protein